MFEARQGPKGPYPTNEKETKELVANVINFVHTKEISDGIVDTLQSAQDKPIEAVAQMGAMMTVKVVQSVEAKKERDIPPETELGVLAMIIEELFTIAANMGLQVDESMISNAVQIGSGFYNQMIQGAAQGPQVQPQMEAGAPGQTMGQAVQPQGQPPQGLMGGM